MTTNSTDRPSLTGTVGEFRPGSWTPKLIVTLVALVVGGELGGLAFLYPISALPGIAAEFQTDQVGWVATAHSLAGGVSAALIGNLADRFGKKRVMLVVIALAFVGLIVSATAPTFGVLLIGRVLTGPTLAVAFLIPSLIRDLYPTKILPFATSVGTTGSGALAIVASLLVGTVILSFGFRGTFWIPAIFTVISFVVVAIFVPEGRRSENRASLDLLGAALLGLGAAGLLLAVSLVQSLGFTSPVIITAFIVGALLIAGWVIRSLKVLEPLVDLRLLATRPALITLSLSALGVPLIVWFYTLMAMVPIASGDGWGLGLPQTSVSLFTALFVAVGLATAFVAGRALSRVSVPAVAIFAAVEGIVGYIVAFLGLSSVPLFIIATILVGGLTGFVYAVTYNLVVLVVAPQHQATTASVVSLCANFGSAVTSVVIFAFMNAQPQTIPGLYGHSALALATLIPAAMAVVVLVLSVVLLRGRQVLQAGEAS